MNRQERQTTEILRKLYLKLFLRGRRPGIGGRKMPTSVARKLAGTLVLYALVGIQSAFHAIGGVFPLSLQLHNITMLFTVLFVSGMSGSILFDEKEGDILLHRPLKPEQLLRAKIRTMIEIAMWLAAALNLGGLVSGTLINWRFLPAHLLSTGMSVLFCTSAVVLAYQICLRFFDREKIDNIMTTSQVLVAALAFLVIVMVPRLMKAGGSIQLEGLHTGFYLLPSAWFAGMDVFLTGSKNLEAFVLAVLATGATVALPWIAVVRLSDNYQKGLRKLEEHTPSRARKTSYRQRRGTRLPHIPVLSWFLRKPEVAVGFRLTTAYMLRDRQTKLSLYPGVAPFLIMPLLMLIPHAMEGSANDDSFVPLFGIAITSGYIGFLPLSALNILQFSKDSEAYDFFRLTPMRGPGPLVHGARLAVMTVLVVPSVLVIGAVTYFLARSSPDFLLLLLPGILTTPVYAHLTGSLGKSIPLSLPVEDARAATRGLWIAAAMIPSFIVSSLGLVAWKADVFGYFLAGEALLALALCLIMRLAINRLDWPRQETQAIIIGTPDDW